MTKKFDWDIKNQDKQIANIIYPLLCTGSTQKDRKLSLTHHVTSMPSMNTLPTRRFVVSYKKKYVHEVLVNRLVKFAQEKVWLGELTVSTWYHCCWLGYKISYQTNVILTIQNICCHLHTKGKHCAKCEPNCNVIGVCIQAKHTEVKHVCFCCDL